MQKFFCIFFLFLLTQFKSFTRAKVTKFLQTKHQNIISMYYYVCVYFNLTENFFAYRVQCSHYCACYSQCKIIAPLPPLEIQKMLLLPWNLYQIMADWVIFCLLFNLNFKYKLRRDGDSLLLSLRYPKEKWAVFRYIFLYDTQFYFLLHSFEAI